MKQLLNCSAALAVSLLVFCAAITQAGAADGPFGGSSLPVSENDTESHAPARISPNAPTVSTNGLLFFTSRSEFETGFPGLPKETFEESPVAPAAFINCTGPLDSTTNNACFVPGDILPGLSIDGDPNHAMAATGIGYFGLTTTSKSVAATTPADILTISFTSGTINAVGMDLAAFNPATATINVYGAGNVLLDTMTSPTIQTAETFWGVYSSQAISKITVQLTGGTFHEVVDNIQFGPVTQEVTFSTDRTAFTTAHPGLTTEDFEESPVASGALVQLPEPLTTTTNVPGAFVPGDIVTGLGVATVSTATPATSLSVIGDNYLGLMTNASKMVCSSYANDNLRTSFTAYNAYAVGMDLMPAVISGSGDQTAVIIAYGVLGKILGTTTVTLSSTQETFVGMYSSKYLIGQATAMINSASLAECVDNIRFGGSPVDLTFYTSDVEFKKVRSNMPEEDFSKSTVVDNTVQLCDEPINSASNQANCFSPGDIKPGISFQTVDSLGAGCPTCMRLYGRNYGTVGNATPLLTAEAPDSLEISFPGKNIYYAGMDFYTSGVMHIYDTQGNFLGEAVRLVAAYGDFWGVKSAKPIGRIASWMVTPVIGPVLFGSKFPWPMFLPAINGGPAPATP